jgi:hypothetical protein
MSRLESKALRFAWRASRNLICALPGGARTLYPAAALSRNFGRGDAAYALEVFGHHSRQLAAAGFAQARQVLEVGPGRNLGTSLLWWCALAGSDDREVQVRLWDAYPNANPSQAGYWQATAAALLAEIDEVDGARAIVTQSQVDALRRVAAGRSHPDIDYMVCGLDRLAKTLAPQSFGLIYSHAALEHVRRIADFWTLVGRLTARSGWHSHRIDLADHGRRETNYIEMLEWSPIAWWCMTRFTPGTINRWRASDHVLAVRRAGLRVEVAKRDERPWLPVTRKRLARAYRNADELDLRTTAIDIVARRE